MTTAIIFIGVLGAGAFWMYRQGVSSAEKENLESDLKKIKKINEIDTKHDSETDEILGALDDSSNVNRVRSPINRNR